jgi:putative membrane protein
MSLSDLPHVNVALNALSAVLLTAGYIAIRMRRVRWHRGLMIAAMIASALFLASYLTYHFGVELTRKYTGTWRTFYYVVLPIHVIGAMVNLPMVLVTAWHAFRGSFRKHRRIARLTLPLWWFVCVTGVIVYVMLY